MPRLTLKWAFAFPDTSTMRSQPAVYRGRIFVGSQDGSVYALDAATGCVHWTTMVQSQVRSGIAIGEIAGNPAIFFGDSAGFVYALDGATGKQLWRMRPDEHPASTMTATPVFYQGRLYVGAASREEALSVSPGYQCCTFRGSESALDAATGKTIWKRYMIPDVAKQRAKTKQGAAAFGPSGVGVWTAPTLDPERDTMYVTTGDNYSDPATSHERLRGRPAIIERRDSVVQTTHRQGRLEQLLPAPRQSELPGYGRPGFRFRGVRDPDYFAKWFARAPAGTEIRRGLRHRSR